MSSQISSPDLANTPNRPEAAEAADDTRYFRRVLRHLVQVGDDFCEMLHQEAKQIADTNAAAAALHHAGQTAPSPATPPHITDAFERITRSMRRSMVLYRKLGEPDKAPSAEHRIAARKRIIRDVEDVIQRKAADDEQETLHAELLERLDSPDLEDEIADRPVAEIVTDICRDLGIAAMPGTHPWKRRVPHDIAILKARAEKPHGEAPSAELASLIATAPPPPPRRSPIAGSFPPMEPAEEVAMILEAVWRDRWESGAILDDPPPPRHA